MRLKQKTNSPSNLPQNIYLWLLIASLTVSLIITVTALRNNNQTMITLRDKVYAADEANGDVNGALNELRSYVYAHMNTSLSTGSNGIKPPLQLKYTYQRLEASEQSKLEKANSQIYTDAQNYCQSQNSADFSGRNRVPCVQDYITNHGVVLQTVPAALYQFDFVSPTWSPDLAGFSLLVTIFLALVLLATQVARLIAVRKMRV